MEDKIKRLKEIQRDDTECIDCVYGLKFKKPSGQKIGTVDVCKCKLGQEISRKRQEKYFLSTFYYV